MKPVNALLQRETLLGQQGDSINGNAMTKYDAALRRYFKTDFLEQKNANTESGFERSMQSTLMGI